MNPNPNTAFPVQQQMSQQFPHHPSFTPTPRSAFHLPPQQSPIQNQTFPASYHPSTNQPIPAQQLHHHQLQQQQQQQQQQQVHPQQRFPQQVPYQGFQQPLQPFYSPLQPSGSGNGLMPASTPHGKSSLAVESSVHTGDVALVTPQVYAPLPNVQVGNPSTFPLAPGPPPEGSPSLPPSQHSQNMAGPSTPLSPYGSSNVFSQRPTPPSAGTAQNSQSHNSPRPTGVSQAAPSTLQPQSQSPPSVARENLRVSVLLEINAYLLQEVVSLQGQGKAGGGPGSLPQQFPAQEPGASSPTSNNDASNPLNNSPVDPSKPGGAKHASQEYVDCMRRLQANLAYLAAVADAKKKAAGTVPARPAITAPPSHLPDVRPLYKKLNTLFPNAGPPTLNKTMIPSGSQAQNVG